MRRMFEFIFIILVIVGCWGDVGPKPVEVEQKYLNLEFYSDGTVNYSESFCLVRDYLFSKEKIEPLSAFVEIPLDQCRYMTGYDIENYEKVNGFNIEAVNEYRFARKRSRR